jgi:hypothetical protein
VALQRSSSGDRKEQVLQEFNYVDGANPLAGLILDAENNLYGATLDDLLGGKGHLSLDEDLVKLSKSGQPADYAYVESSLYRQETLITPTLSATVSREACLAQTQGQSVRSS